jgi:putative endonuclease
MKCRGLFMYTVYILYSDSADKHYVGYTSNLEQRMLSHNHLGKKGFTTRYRPWRIIHLETFSNETEAIRREKWFKTGVGRDYINKIKH